MGTFIEAGLIKDGDKYVITYVDFPDSKEYKNFCADFIDYAERNDIKDYNKNAYIEYIRKQKQQAVERYPMTGSAGSGEGWRTAWENGVRSVPSAAFVPTQFTADIYYGFTIDKFNTTKTSSAAESLVSIESFSRKNRDHILDIMGGTRGVLPADVDLIQHTIGTVDWGDNGQIYGGVEYDVDQFFGGNVLGERLVRAYSLGTDGGQQVLHTHYYLLQSPEKGGYDRIITFRFLTATTKPPIAAKDGEWTIYLDDSDCERWLKTLRAVQPAAEAPTADAIASTAKNQVGKEYVLNASGPDEFDSSGLVYYVLNECGIAVDRKDCAGYAQNADWSKIESLGDVKAGDILFFYGEDGKIQHAGIAVSSKNMIDASSSHRKVAERGFQTRYWKEHFAFARRVVE